MSCDKLVIVKGVPCHLPGFSQLGSTTEVKLSFYSMSTYFLKVCSVLRDVKCTVQLDCENNAT